MWIGDVDVPQAVLDAAEAGRLVIFVGAGASLAKPSCLPNFADLVREIGDRAGREATDDEAKHHPDIFLGKLEDGGVDVHTLVSAAIDRPGSKPNPLHAAVVALAAACRTPRLVTTNYDLHLTSAAEAQGFDFRVYEAPALPVGDDFDGIVHLHGSLSQPSRRLVVTDSDFGKAYLREAWAARFLERMFSTFTVLFIGYSHGDVVMQYLARSLGPDHNRYVLTDDAQNGDWRRLGLMPISYQNEIGDHSALPASLDRWVGLATMGQVEHRARIAALVSGEPPTIPEEASYIEGVLSHPERIRYFEEKARFAEADRSHRWFAWIQSGSAFSKVFSQYGSDDVTSRVLMSWIADQYMLIESNSGVALRAFRDKPWPTDTWSVITQTLLGHKGAFPRWLGPWLQLVLQNAPYRQHDLLDMMLTDRDWSKNFDLALMLFEDRTRPHLKRAMDFGAPTDAPRFEVDLCGDEHWLTENWKEIFLPALGDHLEQVISLVSEQIARVYRSLRSLDPEGTYDPIAFSRSAIERHEQDGHRDPVDVLIDGARDCIETALSDDPPLAERYLDAWSGSPDAILRRLAVHGWRARTDVGSDEKLSWMREQNLLWDVPLQHEVFQLIRDSLPTASESTARGLVEDAVAGPPGGDDDRHTTYRSYNLLGWLTDSAPALAIAKAAFEQSQKEHPEFGRREHPDLTHYGSVGFAEDAVPYTASELHELVAQDPIEALARLREFQPQSHALEGPTWAGALRSLQACVAVYPEDGTQVARVLQIDDSDIRASLIRGWNGATLDAVLTGQVLAIIAGWDPDEIRRPACAMLSNGGQPEHPTRWHQFERARQLAADLWPTSDVEGTVGGGHDLVMEAINHPAGDLAKFWTKVVQWEWSDNESSWDGIPQGVVPHLDRLVSSADRNGLLARTFFASQLHFFVGADSDWCQDRLLPLFDWTTNKEQATAAWQGFLTWGRWNDALLNAGLLEGYIETTNHADELPDELRRQLATHLTSIAMLAPSDPATWLTRFIVAAPDDIRVAWAKQVDFALTRLDPGEAPRQWDRWIEKYWSGRNQSVPRPFTPAEASVTAGWVLGLGGVRAQAIDLVLGSPAALARHGRVLYHLEDLEDLELAAEASDWARFLTHLLTNTNEPKWGIGYHLQTIVPRLRAGNPPPDLTQLINEAMRLGVTNAPDW